MPRGSPFSPDMVRELRAKVTAVEKREATSLELDARKDLIAERNALFVETGDPPFAWEVIKLCIKYGLPIPSKIESYLRDTAERLLALTVDPKGAADRIPQALGFDGKRTVSFTKYGGLRKREDVCRTIALKVLKGDGIEAALQRTCEEMQISKSRLRSWMNEFFPGRGKQRWQRFLRAGTDPHAAQFDPRMLVFLQNKAS